MGLQYKPEHHTENYIMKKLKIKLFHCSDDLNANNRNTKQQKERETRNYIDILSKVNVKVLKKAQLPRIITIILDSCVDGNCNH